MVYLISEIYSKPYVYGLLDDKFQKNVDLYGINGGCVGSQAFSSMHYGKMVPVDVLSIISKDSEVVEVAVQSKETMKIISSSKDLKDWLAKIQEDSGTVQFFCSKDGKGYIQYLALYPSGFLNSLLMLGN